MNKHTPGPWQATKYGYEKWSVNARRTVEICAAWNSADARLIAAAPDLLEALELLIEECDPMRLNCGEPWCRARSAIAKAKGEQA